MATYSEKKKPAINSSRDSSADLDATLEVEDEMTSTVASPSYPTGVGGPAHRASTPTAHGDSIEEMAGALLDDTQLEQEMVPRSSRISWIPHGEDHPGWESPDNSSVQEVNKMEFTRPDNEDSPRTSSNRFCHRRKRSAPSIPRRSSKRKTARSKSGASKLQPQSAQNPAVSKISAPLTHVASSSQHGGRGLQPHSAQRAAVPKISGPMNISVPSSQVESGSALDAKKIGGDLGPGIQSKLDAMLAANNALKPPPPPKKKTFKDSLNKIKAVINDSFGNRSGRKKEDPARGRRLEPLVRSNNAQDGERSEVTYAEEEGKETEVEMNSSMSEAERAYNEGRNFASSKVRQKTGDGHVRRKPVADDGKSIRSKRSFSDDPFRENGMMRKPTRFENHLIESALSEMTDDEIIKEEDEEALHSFRDAEPGGRTTTQSETFKDSTKPAENLLPRTLELPIRPRDRRNPDESFNKYGGDFDAFFSSSPVAQSTPRIFVESPPKEVDSKDLGEIHAQAQSLSGHGDSSLESSDMGGDTSEIHVSPTKDSCDTDVYRQHLSVNPGRRKKHPSPSKAEWERMQKALPVFPSTTTENNMPIGASRIHSGVSTEYRSLYPKPRNTALATKDPNIHSQEPLTDKMAAGQPVEADIAQSCVPLSKKASNSKVQQPLKENFPEAQANFGSMSQKKMREKVVQEKVQKDVENQNILESRVVEESHEGFVTQPRVPKKRGAGKRALEPQSTKRHRSMIPKPVELASFKQRLEAREEQKQVPTSTLEGNFEESDTETDELHGDMTAYRIGKKKF